MPRLPSSARRILLRLAAAQLSRRRVLLRYREAGGRWARRAAEVVSLAFDSPRWLVAAWCPGLSSLRVLDVARVSGVEPLGERAGPPPAGFDPVDFAVHRFLDPAAGPVRRLELTLDHRAAALARALIPTSRTRSRGGRAVCVVRASRPEVVARLAISLGPAGALDSPGPMATSPVATRQKPAEARLLGLASWILEQPEPVTREQVYQAFPDDYRGAAAAAEKKFSRDKDALRRLGFNLEVVPLGKQGPGYAIDPRSCPLPATDFTPEESAVLWTAGTAALRLSLHPLREELESAFRKLVLGARGLPPGAASTDELSADATPDAERHLVVLIDGWERRRRVRIRYWRASTGEAVEREVDVYGWASRRGEWLFAGYCHLRKAVRVFYVSRVRSVGAARGARDGGYAIPATFDIRRWSRQQVWDYELHPPRTAVVRLRGPLARIARQLLPGARLETDPSGARLARLEVRNLRGLVRQALAWGPDAELVEPEEGRGMAREMLSSLATWSAP